MDEILCATCGRPMPPAKRKGASKRYCSATCRAGAWRRAKLDELNELKRRMAELEARNAE